MDKYANFYMILKIKNGSFIDFVKIKTPNKDNLETIFKLRKISLFLFSKNKHYSLFMNLILINNIFRYRNLNNIWL